MFTGELFVFRSICKPKQLILKMADPSFSDAILVCQGKEIKINKFLMAARSDVFRKMLSSQDFIEGEVFF